MNRYAYFTRKQAGIIYSAAKRGTMNVDRKAINRMYNLVECKYENLSYDERDFLCHMSEAIRHLFADRIELAQAEVDGKTVYSKPHVVGRVHLVVTEDNYDAVVDNIDLFAEVGDVIDEEVTDGFDWFVE